MGKEREDKPDQLKEVCFNGKFFDYALHLERGSGNRMLIILPGLGSNTRSQDRALRKIKTEMGSSLHFNSLTLKFTGPSFDVNQAMTEVEELLRKIKTNHDIHKFVLMGSSIGAGYSLRLAQKLFAEKDHTIEIEGLILIMPCINDRSVKGNSILFLKRFPPFLAKGGLNIAYQAKEIIGHLIHDSFESDETVEAKYNRIVSVPSSSHKPIHPQLPVHLFISTKDLLINNEQVLKDMMMITKRDNIHINTVSPTGVNNHDFKPQEWLEVAKTLLIPTLSHIWT